MKACFGWIPARLSLKLIHLYYVALILKKCEWRDHGGSLKEREDP